MTSMAYATEHGCVLYTFNVSDFYRLHTEWTDAGREHAGVILALPAVAQVPPFSRALA